MNKTIHRTYPKLLFTGTFFFSSLLFAVLTLYVLQNIIKYNNSLLLLHLSLLLVTVILTCISLSYLLKTKVILLTESQFIISNFFYPKKLYYNLSEIQTIKLSKQTVTNYFPDTFNKYQFDVYKTTIEIVDRKNITITSIGDLEFDYLYNSFSKQKRGEGKVKKIKGRFISYIIDNIGGLILNIIWFLLVFAIFLSLYYS